MWYGILYRKSIVTVVQGAFQSPQDIHLKQGSLHVMLSQSLLHFCEMATKHNQRSSTVFFFCIFCNFYKVQDKFNNCTNRLHIIFTNPHITILILVTFVISLQVRTVHCIIFMTMQRRLKRERHHTLLLVKILHLHCGCLLIWLHFDRSTHTHFSFRKLTAYFTSILLNCGATECIVNYTNIYLMYHTQL